jgi:hypothetical protein
MKKIAIILILILTILLALAAVHDILKGEPNLTTEYIVLGSSLILLAAMLIKLRRKTEPKNRYETD